MLDTNLMLDWPEIAALFFLIIGFFTALFSGNAITLYSVCFLTGLLFGRVWYKYRKKESIPVFLFIVALFLGFVLGAIWANLRLISLMLLAGILIGYWLHAKKIIRTL